jgi:hypothetical protein
MKEGESLTWHMEKNVNPSLEISKKRANRPFETA